MNNSNKCKHGYYTDPNGYHIYPSKTTAELIEEANRLFKTTVEPKTETKPKPKSTNEVRAFHRLLNDAADY